MLRRVFMAAGAALVSVLAITAFFGDKVPGMVINSPIQTFTFFAPSIFLFGIPILVRLSYVIWPVDNRDEVQIWNHQLIALLISQLYLIYVFVHMSFTGLIAVLPRAWMLDYMNTIGLEWAAIVGPLTYITLHELLKRSAGAKVQ